MLTAAPVHCIRRRREDVPMTGKHVAGREPRVTRTQQIDDDPEVQLDEDAEPFDLVPDPERTVALDDPAEVAEAIVDAEDAKRDGGEL
jgi:hypothetical protein